MWAERRKSGWAGAAGTRPPDSAGRLRRLRRLSKQLQQRNWVGRLGDVGVEAGAVAALLVRRQAVAGQRHQQDGLAQYLAHHPGQLPAVQPWQANVADDRVGAPLQDLLQPLWAVG